MHKAPPVSNRSGASLRRNEELELASTYMSVSADPPPSGDAPTKAHEALAVVRTLVDA